MPVVSGPGDATRSRPARRKRRIWWTVAALAVTAAAGTWLGIAAYRAGQPRPYEPGDENVEITKSYAQPYQKSGASAEKAEGKASEAEGLRAIEQALPAGAPPPRLLDVTEAAGLARFRTFSGARTSQLPEDMGSGLAWGDFDNDGFDDLFLVSAGGALGLPPEQRAPSELYRNLGNGAFEKVAGFPETRILGMGAAWGDADNDGRLDLIVTGFDAILLFRNQTGKLVRDARFPSPKGFWTGVAWGDYDRDGDLDVYVCGYVQYKPRPGGAVSVSKQFGLEVPYTLNPSSFEPERNLLFRNDGATFTEVARPLGVDNREGRSLSALWHDFDGDGWLDLYIGNDISENKLFLNRRGRFLDQGKQAWVAEYRGSMGLAAGDWDGDGDDDLFISHWVAQQYALYNSLLSEQKEAAAEVKAGEKPAAGLHFMDVAEMSGIGHVSLQFIGWGAEFADLDSDGWLDLVVANGSTFETQDAPRRLVPMESFLFWNKGGKFFYNLAPWNLSLSSPFASRGLAVADYDQDGAVDVAVTDLGGGVRLLRNRIKQGNWLELRLRHNTGKAAPGFGENAVLTAYAGGRAFRRAVSSASYLSQSSRAVHFGLGAASKLDKLEVRWPSGATDVYTDLALNSLWEVRQGDPRPRRIQGPAAAGPLSKEKTLEFWTRQRAAMDALKRDRDVSRAIPLFREALALNPSHEDSRYYLASCLATQGDRARALEQLDELIRINPQSHRAYLQRSVLLATSASAKAALEAAEQSAEKALALNPEETGSMLVLGEIALARGDLPLAERRFELACRTNPKAVGGLFLRAYIAWKGGDAGLARQLLATAHAARGKEWKPKGSALEGDVQRRMHIDGTLFSPVWEAWDGAPEPSAVLGRVDAELRARGWR